VQVGGPLDLGSLFTYWLARDQQHPATPRDVPAGVIPTETRTVPQPPTTSSPPTSAKSWTPPPAQLERLAALLRHACKPNS
jgi:hypothetical protein